MGTSIQELKEARERAHRHQLNDTSNKLSAVERKLDREAAPAAEAARRQLRELATPPDIEAVRQRGANAISTAAAKTERLEGERDVQRDRLRQAEKATKIKADGVAEARADLRRRVEEFTAKINAEREAIASVEAPALLLATLEGEITAARRQADVIRKEAAEHEAAAVKALAEHTQRREQLQAAIDEEQKLVGERGRLTAELRQLQGGAPTADANDKAIDALLA